MVAMILIAWPLGGVVIPPAKEIEMVDTPLTTVMVKVVVVAVSKFAESVGVKSAVSGADPSAPGVQEHVAVVVDADAVPHPAIVAPFNLKFTTLGFETVAVMVIAPPSAAVVEELGSEIVIVVVALITEIVICLKPD